MNSFDSGDEISSYSPAESLKNFFYQNLFPLVAKVGHFEENLQDENQVEKKSCFPLTKPPLCSAKPTPVQHDEAALQINEVVFENGNVYSGIIDENLKLDGNGLFQWKDDFYYKGPFLDNRANGVGKLVTRNGEIFDGHFNSGVLHGNGTFSSEYFNYIGEFLNGKFDGEGVLKSVPLLFEGVLSKNIMVKGTRKYLNGLFVGNFDELGYKKFGTYTFNNGDKYSGSFCNDRFSGFGCYEWKAINKNIFLKYKEQSFSGFFINSEKHGLGMHTFQERCVLAIWEKNFKNGPGLIIAANSEIFVGERMFVNNNYNESWKLSLNEDSIKFINCLLEFPVKGNLKNCFIPAEHEIDKIFSTTEIFQKIVGNLMCFAEAKTDAHPLFLPNFAMNIDFACLKEITNNSFQNSNARLSCDIRAKKKLQQECLAKNQKIIDKAVNENHEKNLLFQEQLPFIRSCRVKKIEVEKFPFKTKNFSENFLNQQYEINSIDTTITNFSSKNDSDSSNYTTSNVNVTLVEEKHLTCGCLKVKKNLPISDDTKCEKFQKPHISKLRQEFLEKELKSLNQSIIENINLIEGIYMKYSILGQKIENSKIQEEICMQRLGLWLFYKDVFKNLPNFNIVTCLEEAYKAYNILSEKVNDPFDLVYFNEFLRHLLHIVCCLNRDPHIREHARKENFTIFGKFATMFLIFLREYERIEFGSGSIYLTKIIGKNPKTAEELLKKIYDSDCSFELDIRSAFRFFQNIKNTGTDEKKNLEEYRSSVNVKSRSLQGSGDFKKKSSVKSKITDEIDELKSRVNGIYEGENLKQSKKIKTFLFNVNNSDFVECATKLFPKLYVNGILNSTEFKISPIDLFDLIILLFEKQIFNLKKNKDL